MLQLSTRRQASLRLLLGLGAACTASRDRIRFNRVLHCRSLGHTRQTQEGEEKAEKEETSAGEDQAHPQGCVHHGGRVPVFQNRPQSSPGPQLGRPVAHEEEETVRFFFGLSGGGILFLVCRRWPARFGPRLCLIPEPTTPLLSLNALCLLLRSAV